MTAYFITATGTDCGKTFITAALLAAARARGLSAHAYKPVMSGWRAEDTASDAHLLRAAGGNQQSLDALSCYRFAAPLSPHQAAAKEGTTIDWEQLVGWCRTHVATATPQSPCYLEGAGGVMTPITTTRTMRDLAAALAIPVILVSGTALGSISHTLTAIEALRAVNVPIHALILNESADSTIPLAEAHTAIAPFVRSIPHCLVQPHVASLTQAESFAALL